MKALKHILEQPFIFATGLAALIHSTWSLGTFFAGEIPTDYASLSFWLWLLPALLIAFAMDVGQISTSAQIRAHGMTFARGATFAVFAIATYYLQWLYIAHHMPALDLAAGVSEFHRPLTIFLRDMGIWIIPALLPLSTLMYTFSGDTSHAQNLHSDDTDTLITITAPQDKQKRLPEYTSPDDMHDDSDLLHLDEDSEPIALLWCDACDYNTGIKETMEQAERALRAHKSRFCAEQE